MMYDYRNDAGDLVAREYPMGKAPAELNILGERYWRDYSGIRLGRTKEEAHVSLSVPLKGSRFDDPKNPAPHYTADGRGAFATRREAKEWAKRSQTIDGGYVYDD